MYLLVLIALIMFTLGFSDFRRYYTDFGGTEMAGSGRFPGWRIPTPMPGWQSCRPPADRKRTTGRGLLSWGTMWRPVTRGG